MATIGMCEDDMAAACACGEDDSIMSLATCVHMPWTGKLACVDA